MSKSAEEFYEQIAGDANRFHYWLFTGEILFRAKEDEPIMSMRLNTIVTDRMKKIPVALIGKAQQGLQMQFFKKLNDPTMQVVDVVILGIQHLGHFTSKEFHAPPEGQALAKMETPGNA